MQIGITGPGLISCVKATVYNTLESLCLQETADVKRPHLGGWEGTYKPRVKKTGKIETKMVPKACQKVQIKTLTVATFQSWVREVSTFLLVFSTMGGYHFYKKKPK